MDPSDEMELPPEIAGYYALGQESGRLEGGSLERVRTQEILLRHLPPPPAVVLDVGGGAGVYALWLAARGYAVHLVDPVALHVEQALAASAARAADPLASARVGDARALDHPSGSADVVLLLGPLYHLVAREDRMTALREARRVLRPSGLVVAAAISRFASLLDGLARGFLADPDFARIVRQDLADGQHRNPTGKAEYFTTAFFHRPEELEQEVVEAGLRLEALVGVEGPAGMVPDLHARGRDVAFPETLLELLRRVESEPALLGASAHLVAIGRRPDAALTRGGPPP